MHSLQQSIENDRANAPPVGSIPGSYMHSTIQYYPASSQTHMDRHGLPLYAENMNKLSVPNEYKRPSSAPLTPVEPKKIGRRFRRSSSVEEPCHPDPISMHENDLRRNNGLSRYDMQPSEVCVRTSDGKITVSDPNRIVATSHYPGFDGSIMSHSKPISYNYRHEYDSKVIKTERNNSGDSKEINYRPYIDNQHPYSNIKKNLTERFMKAEDEANRSTFNPPSTSYHPGAPPSRPPDHYFSYGQYPPSSESMNYYNKVNVPYSRGMDGAFRVPYPGQSESLSSRPHHGDKLPPRSNHSDPSLIRPPMHKEDQDARVQAMNTYFEMMANVHQVGNPQEALYVRSREVIIQKGGSNAPTVIHNEISHSLPDSRHPRPRDFQEKHASDSQGVVRHPHPREFQEKHASDSQGVVRHPHPREFQEKHASDSQGVVRHPHPRDFQEKHVSDSQGVVRHPHPREFQEKHASESQGVVRHPHHIDVHEKVMSNQQAAIRYPPHNIQEKGGGNLQPSVIRGGMESSAAPPHNIHGVIRPPNPPWPHQVPPSDAPSHEKEQKRNYFHPPPPNTMDCGCPYPKRHMGECKLRNESFKHSEGDHADHSRYINMRNATGQYEMPNPYENPQYRRPEKVHPPDLISYHDKHNEYMNTPPPSRGVNEMVTPPVLKNESLRPDTTTSPSNIKKTPRPGPIIIPPTINNKAIFSTPCVMGRSTLTLPQSIYTPPPMLSPKSIFFNPPLSFQRVTYTPASTGYVCQTPRRVSLIDKPHETPTPAVSSASIEKQTSVEEFQPKINVGPQFQATVPNVSDKAEAHKDVHRAGLMWSPLKEDKQKYSEVSEYLEMACSLALYGGGTNKEYALHILQRTRGNVKEAIRLVLSRRHILRADDPNADYHYSGSTRWNAKERLAFRTSYRTKGKIFSQIQKEIGTKSVQLCVEFYYLWKAKHPESFRVRTRQVEAESEQDEDEVPPTPTAAVAPLSTLREPVFECDYPDCLARFISRQALNGHIRVHGGSHTKAPDARRPPKEKGPHMSTPKNGLGSMDSPLKKKKPASSEPTLASDGSTLQFQCKVCGRVFSKVKSRSAHMKTHVKKDENNKPIKTPKNKGPVEIQHMHKPFDILIHAAANSVPSSYDPSNMASNISIHNSQSAFNLPVDNNKPLYPPVDNNKPLYNPAMNNIRPSFHPSMDNTPKPPYNLAPDNSRPPFNSTVENTKSSFIPAMENTKPPFNSATESAKPLYDHIVENKTYDHKVKIENQTYDHSVKIENKTYDHSVKIENQTYDHSVANTKPSFDDNNNNNNISSINPST